MSHAVFSGAVGWASANGVHLLWYSRVRVVGDYYSWNHLSLVRPLFAAAGATVLRATCDEMCSLRHHTLCHERLYPVYPCPLACRLHIQLH